MVNMAQLATSTKHHHHFLKIKKENFCWKIRVWPLYHRCALIPRTIVLFGTHIRTTDHWRKIFAAPYSSFYYWIESLINTIQHINFEREREQLYSQLFFGIYLIKCLSHWFFFWKSLYLFFGIKVKTKRILGLNQKTSSLGKI